MDAVNLADAKARLSELVSKAESGVETVITRRGQPVARLVPITLPKKAFRSLADFRATLPMARTSSAELIRQMRDEGY
ncbi:MAG: type II toxin-antitoxin system prevent-host-death family antitoxin [Betaproteobacteria bacterium]|nr:type II toxin-antitoxin system prevent-host-death family antitoxin [Betaproteobacteria bacterium]